MNRDIDPTPPHGIPRPAAVPVECDHCGDPVTVAGDETCGDCQRYLMRGC